MEDCMLNQFFEGMVGREWVVRHLTSPRGVALNGKRGRVSGVHTGPAGDARLIVHIPGEPLPLRLRADRLAEAGTFTDAPSRSVLPDDLLAPLLASAVAAMTDSAGRADQVARLAHLRTHLDARTLPPPSACMDPLLPQEVVAADEHLRVLTAIRPCCAGDGRVVFSRFGEGLYGSGAVCAVCLEDLPVGRPVAGLPCGHTLHTLCAAAALAAAHVCPTCKVAPPPQLDGRDYVVDASVQLLVRAKEWIVSGMCERCQASYQEADPLLAVPAADGTVQLVPQSQVEVRGGQRR